MERLVAFSRTGEVNLFTFSLVPLSEKRRRKKWTDGEGEKKKLVSGGLVFGRLKCLDRKA